MRNGRLGRVLLALLAFISPLLTAPGQIAADTKQYLYLNPGRLMRTATSLWDPAQFGGYVTHQTIGYLWPAAPWYWVWDRLGMPDWVAQRLWLGALFWLAGAGVWKLARLLGLTARGALVAAALYQLSPYVLSYANRTSILLAPWAGLGWIMSLTVLASRHRGWKYPALVALVVATVGGINATALVLVAVAPVTWLVKECVIDRRITPRHTLAVAGKIGALSTLLSAWWIVALWVQAWHGADVLAYSETVQAVSSTSTSPEVLRGLGYWLFYGGDANGAWNSASTPYTQSPALIALGFVITASSMAALRWVRGSERLWLAGLWLIGLSVAVGAHGSSVFSTLLRSGNGRSTILLALRSSTRAVPLMLLAAALSLGTAVDAVRTARSWVPALAVVVILGANLPALWNGSFVDAQLRRPEAIPAAWRQAADALQQGGASTRVLELPGQEFAAYRWGTTTDQLLPGLMDRPIITRDLLPLGSAQMTDLALALDNRVQDGTLDPAGIGPVARLLGVGAVVVRGDEKFEVYRTPRPEQVATMLGTQPAGMGPPATFGAPLTNLGPPGQLDPVALGSPTFPLAVPAATVWPVTDPSSIVRTKSVTGSVLISGSGDGVVAAANLLPSGSLLRYSADATDDAQRTAWATEAGLVVITDSNRKRATQWRGSKDTEGMTEDEGRGVLNADPADVRLPVFPDASTRTQTLALQVGGTAHASAYGEPNAYRPEDRAVMAVDGDPTTFWRVAEGTDATAQHLDLRWPTSRTMDGATLRQPNDGRVITGVSLKTDAGTSVMELDERSWSAGGQPLPPMAPTAMLDLTIQATSGGNSFVGAAAVGIDLHLAGPPVREIVRLPIDLVDALGARIADVPLAIVWHRQRADASSTYRHDPEPSLIRQLRVGAALPLTLSGTARVSDVSADRLLWPSLSSSGHLAGFVSHRVGAAFDRDPATTWISPMGHADGTWIETRLSKPVTIEQLSMKQADDPRFSRADSVDVTVDGVTETAPIDAAGGVRIAPRTGTTVRLTFHVSSPRTTIDRHHDQIVDLPISVADVDLGQQTTPDSTSLLPTACRSDLLTLDERPLPITIAVDGSISSCNEQPIVIGTGDHVVAAAPGRDTGVDIDRLIFQHGTVGAPAPITAPKVTTTSSTDMTVDVAAHAVPTWLIVGQGWTAGWVATLDGRSLGEPAHVDGGSMGWPLPSSASLQRVRVTWRPQRWVNVGLAASGAGALGCIIVALRRRRPIPDVAPLRAVEDGERSAGHRVGQPLVIVLVASGLAAVLVSGWAALAVMVVTLFGMKVPRARRIALGAATGLVLFIGLYVAGQQWRHGYRSGFGWPSSFDRMQPLGLLAPMFLVVDALLAMPKRRPGG